MMTITETPSTAVLEASPETTSERTVAFFADPRASTLLLTETVMQLIASLAIRRGLVDLSSVPGLAIAEAFERAGVPYTELQFGQTERFETPSEEETLAHTGYTGSDISRIRSHADGTREVPVAELGIIDANVVLVPSMVGEPGDREELIDFTPGSIPGAVLTQLEAAERAFVVIGTPERGLQATTSGGYERTLLQVASPNRATA